MKFTVTRINEILMILMIRMRLLVPMGSLSRLRFIYYHEGYHKNMLTEKIDYEMKMS